MINNIQRPKRKRRKFHKISGDKWIRVASTRDVFFAKDPAENSTLKKQLFFRFSGQRIQDTPFDFVKDIIHECDESGTLNLVLNARIDFNASLFLERKPIYIKQQFKATEDAKYLRHNNNIQKAFNNVFNGFIKKLEKDNNINMPVVISILIKNYIKVGPAIFYCKGFEIET